MPHAHTHKHPHSHTLRKTDRESPKRRVTEKVFCFPFNLYFYYFHLYYFCVLMNKKGVGSDSDRWPQIVWLSPFVCLPPGPKKKLTNFRMNISPSSSPRGDQRSEPGREATLECLDPSCPEPMFRAMLTLFAADSQVLRNLLLMDRPDNSENRNEWRTWA